MTTVDEPRRRRRPALSCVECRRRKIKCDRENPCGHCKSTHLQCTYSAYGNASSSVPSENAREGPWMSPISSCAHAPAAATSISMPLPGSTPVSLYRQANDNDVHDLMQRVRRLEETSVRTPSTRHDDGRSSKEMPTPQSSLQESNIIINKTRLLGWSRWAGETYEFTKIFNYFQLISGQESGIFFQDPALEPLITEAVDLYQRCKIIARNAKVSRPSRNLAGGPRFDLSPPLRERADVMARLYFSSFESTHRILHEPSFWAEYQQFWDEFTTTKPGVRLKILLVLGIGSSLQAQGPDDLEMRSQVHQWIYAAQTWLSGPLEKDRLDVTGIQVYCLTILARQIFSVGGDLVWMSMGDLVHRAIRMGLHRDPRHLASMTVLQAETHRRLWATILEFLLQSSIDSSMPPRISIEEYDTELPANVNDDEMDDRATDVVPRPRNEYTSTSIQLLMADSFPIRLRIAHLINGLHPEVMYTDVLALSTDMTEACGACGAFMQEQRRNPKVTAFHRNLVDYLVRRGLALLHCAFAFQAQANPLYFYSRKIFLDVAMTVLSPEEDTGFKNLMAMGGGLFREGIRHAVTALGIELLSLTESQQRDGTLNRHVQHREVLKKTLRDVIKLSAERIQHGETNIKMHTYLSMIIGQVEAVEAGVPVEMAMAQVGLESLRFCNGIIESQAGTSALPDAAGGAEAGMNMDATQDEFDWDFDMNFTWPDGLAFS